jgi:Two component regulator propeller
LQAFCWKSLSALPHAKTMPYALAVGADRMIWYSSEWRDAWVARSHHRQGRGISMPYADNGMRDFFLDKDGRIWFGTPPNTGSAIFISPCRCPLTRLRSEPRYPLTCRRARKPLLAGAPTSQGATRSHAATRIGRCGSTCGPAASKAPSLPLLKTAYPRHGHEG